VCSILAYFQQGKRLDPIQFRCKMPASAGARCFVARHVCQLFSAALYPCEQMNCEASPVVKPSIALIMGLLQRVIWKPLSGPLFEYSVPTFLFISLFVCASLLFLSSPEDDSVGVKDYRIEAGPRSDATCNCKT
jgi:hypothetical protein